MAQKVISSTINIWEVFSARFIQSIFPCASVENVSALRKAAFNFCEVEGFDFDRTSIDEYRGIGGFSNDVVINASLGDEEQLLFEQIIQRLGIDPTEPQHRRQTYESFIKEHPEVLSDELSDTAIEFLDSQ